jgi:prevent-host-death family protein
MKVSVQVAASKLSELIDAALSGEDVVIDKGGRPVAKIVAIERRRFQFGVLQGQLGQGPDFFEPMGEDDLKLWEGAA